MVYIYDHELLKEIIISKGKGNLTERGKLLLYQLALNISPKLNKNYQDTDLNYDCMYGGVLKLLTTWKSFNELKYDKCIPYFTELYKRSSAENYNLIVKHSTNCMAFKNVIRFPEHLTEN